MKKQMLVLLAFTTLSSILYAQQQANRQFSRTALEVAGTKLRLGMTKGEVTEKLAGHEITKINEDNWIVASPKDIGPLLQFNKGLLSYAERYWVSHDNDIAEALFGAVTSLNSEGFSECTVKADTFASPDQMAQRVWMLCGEKSLVLIRRSFGGKSYNTVYERLGTEDDISK